MPDDSISLATPVDSDIVEDALRGLLDTPKTLPARLFYDEEGCRLFYRITELPEYYLTRTELALLPRVAPELVGSTPAALIEYGASDETKAGALLDQTDPAGRPAFPIYVPIDVAEPALRAMADRLARVRPELRVLPVAGDFQRPVALPAGLDGLARLGFFPGSTIGNLDPAEARRFLALSRRTLGPGARMLVGVDLRKDAEVLIPAYDDAAGVTAAFNRNILVRLNRETGADFDPGGFSHRAVWNAEEGRIEMHLVSRRAQAVRLDGRTIRFAAGESICTEHSHKYTPDAFRDLARTAGLGVRQVWTDERGWFSVQYLEVD